MKNSNHLKDFYFTKAHALKKRTVRLAIFITLTLFIGSFSASVVFAESPVTPAPLKINPLYAKEVDHCAASNPKKEVIFIKQWHLSPSTNTHDTPKKVHELQTARKFEGINQFPPQSQNQVAIYHQLDEWAKSASLSLLLVEGCTAPTEVNASFQTPFNGWSLSDLQKEVKKPRYDTLLTHVGLKIEAKYGSSVKVECSDNEALIKESQIALSDARADIGYLSRITEFKNDPEKVKTYLDGAIDSYHLPKDIPADQAIAKIKAVLRADVEKVKAKTNERSHALVELIKTLNNPEIVTVWGGLHAAQVKQELESANIGCRIIEPVGYAQDEEKIFSALEAALK